MNKKVILNPNKRTLTRFPWASNVDTNSGKPNKLSMIVSVPLPFTVSTPPNNELRNANNGGTCKVGGTSGGGAAGGGVACTALENGDVLFLGSVAVTVRAVVPRPAGTFRVMVKAVAAPLVVTFCAPRKVLPCTLLPGGLAKTSTR